MAINDKATYGTNLAEIADEMRAILAKARDLYSEYFDTDISSEVNALPSGTDLVPETSFDKDTMLGMVTAMEQYIKFMDNEVVTQNSYRITIMKASSLT